MCHPSPFGTNLIGAEWQDDDLLDMVSGGRVGAVHIGLTHGCIRVQRVLFLFFQYILVGLFLHPVYLVEHPTQRIVFQCYSWHQWYLPSKPTIFQAGRIITLIGKQNNIL